MSQKDIRKHYLRPIHGKAGYGWNTTGISAIKVSGYAASRKYSTVMYPVSSIFASAGYNTTRRCSWWVNIPVRIAGRSDITKVSDPVVIVKWRDCLCSVETRKYNQCLPIHCVYCSWCGRPILSPVPEAYRKTRTRRCIGSYLCTQVQSCPDCDPEAAPSV